MKQQKSLKKILFTVLLTAASALTGILSALILIKPVYYSEARYFIAENNRKGTIYSSADLKPLFLSGSFLDTVSIKLGTRYPPKTLRKMISINAENNTMFFDMKIKSRKPSDVFEVHKTIENMIDNYIFESTNGFLSVQVVSSADFPDRSYRPGIIPIGFLSPIPGMAAALFILSRKKIIYIESENDLSKNYPSYPVLARVPSYSTDSAAKMSGMPDNDLNQKIKQFHDALNLNQILSEEIIYNSDSGQSTAIVEKNVNSDFSLAFRDFHSEIKRFTESLKKIILITSSAGGEGKTSAVINLGLSIASEGKSVLLIDANMHNHHLTSSFNLSSSLPGLSEAALGKTTSKEAIIISEHRSLYIMPSGNYSGNPLGLLTRPETLSMLYNLKSMFDYVIIDTPPLCEYSDALTMTSISDLILLTVRCGFTTEKQVENSVKSFQLSDIRLSGFILNDLPSSASPASKKQSNINPSDSKFLSGFSV